jgi:hypothetical protein
MLFQLRRLTSVNERNMVMSGEKVMTVKMEILAHFTILYWQEVKEDVQLQVNLQDVITISFPFKSRHAERQKKLLPTQRQNFKHTV